MATRADITPELLRQLLRYEPDTGKLFWRERPPNMFRSGGNTTAKGNCNSWNARFSGEEAFRGVNQDGYLRSGICGFTFLAHRVVWALVYGAWPEADIDHVNHDRKDNKIKNLRLVSNKENARNATMRVNNTSGFTGVYYDTTHKKWTSRICVNGDVITLGRFDELPPAIEARKLANKKYGFHENHGKPA